jgi:hypothetical protein
MLMSEIEEFIGDGLRGHCWRFPPCVGSFA